ncbi:MAG: PEP-CTERM sorting domain-containing protein [Candidatus Omnitrophica bacterium]|nr:PEP-CTERM sorting domain-containing protein [Candidatus Omnitrophota bacterium]
MKVSNKWLFVLIVTLLVVFSPSVSHALTAIAGSGSLGSFTGYFDYNPALANLEIIIKNTSPAANGGYLTSFAFNLPSRYITDVSLTTADADFTLFGGTSFSNSVTGAPNGQFDIATGVGVSFLGSGTPSDGLGVGAQETFLFGFTGAGLNTLEDQDFLNETSVPPAIGEGAESFLVRFNGFVNGGSDKVPGVPGDPEDPENPVIPEPATMLLFSAGLLGAFGLKRKNKK